MVEQGLHRRIVVDVQPDGSMVPSRTDIRMKGTAEYFAGPVLRKVSRILLPTNPLAPITNIFSSKHIDQNTQHTVVRHRMRVFYFTISAFISPYQAREGLYSTPSFHRGQI